ncbi:arf-GAP with dual PH domain-containing protein 2 [Salarias fasciatus]|uniref:Arf-GAP with dual PH domain-containing protein 2-like n=1 Tax=Salarias fasciatus TaxID=181472 RepID=A0A672HTU0_SALFA|nr:arf-GAP with dual PH domain-containing protein 2-like [Salarias fasciatus]XP_029944581.1 arf-GAP with dual PH domain-containing protein 2-like [Salarias fasciatus]
MADSERNRKILLGLVKQPGNDRCADCGAPGPDWASCKLGVFVCLQCSGTHRSLSTRVKSLLLDFFEDDVVESMKSKGNAKAKAVYEKAVPPFYYRPQENDNKVLKEQWIRAKYERQEFTGERKYPPPGYTTGFYEGMLWKKGKEKTLFLQRKFVLSEREFNLMYYNKEDESKGPKAVISIKNLNATFQPEKIGHPHGLQITYHDDDHTRNLYVYHESAEEIVTWYNAIRAVRFAYLKTAFPTGKDQDLALKITRNYLKEGYMEKTGPLQKEMFKKRWFILDSQSRALLYFKGPLDAEELGVVFIGTESIGYSVKEYVPKTARGNKWKCGVMVQTPGRQFIFMCEQESEQKEWLEALREVLSRPMAPQDYIGEARVRNRR